MQTVAILGLGTMGMGMAKNLLKAGFTVHAYNRTRAKAAALATEGAHIHETPADAARNADIVIAMLSDDSASRTDPWATPRSAPMPSFSIAARSSMSISKPLSLTEARTRSTKVSG